MGNKRKQRQNYRTRSRITPNSKKSKDRRRARNKSGYELKKQMMLEQERQRKEERLEVIQKMEQDRFEDQCQEDNFEPCNRPAINRVYQKTTSTSLHTSQPQVLKLTYSELAKKFPNLFRVAQNAMKIGKDYRKHAAAEAAKRQCISAETATGTVMEAPLSEQCEETAETAAEMSKLMARQQEAEQHSLVVEHFHTAGNDSQIKKLTGNRIVDIAHVITEARKLEGHVCRVNEKLGHLSFTHENRRGLQSIFNFQCSYCGVKRIFTSTVGKSDEINLAGVRAINSVGKGHEPFMKFLKLLEIPAPTYDTFKKYKDRLKEIGPTLVNPIPENRNHVILPAVSQHDSRELSSGES